ncbi:MAG: preprotein translocase subunit SecE [Firmicutes bacterium]|nr:preprotein translocase subunit SecE [Bacillota bacterium]
MGKKNKKKTIPALNNSGKQQDSVVLEGEAVESQVQNEEVLTEVNQAEPEKVSKKEAKAQKDKKVKKEKKPSKAGKRAKETFSELKKVTWPTFPKVVKQTGIVLAVVLFFGVVLFAFDYILKFLFKLMNSQPYTQTELWLTVGLAGAIVVGAIIWITIWLVKRNKKENK